jgi:uroporphyrinogen decarboxylase
VICFPREIRNYKEFVEIVKPDAINIDYNVDPLMICKNIKIPYSRGLRSKNFVNR